jgi:hypothetical protein
VPRWQRSGERGGPRLRTGTPRGIALLRQFERLAQRFLDAVGLVRPEGNDALLSVVRVDPHRVVAPRRALGGAIEALDRPIDAAQRQVGEARAGAPAMGVLVVADKIHVHDRQAAGEVDRGHRGDELAETGGDKGA